ncbi:MAG: DUF4190 domain-containing protein [Actinobacteria bacterium]|nr:DUF4190 domain-containing protein [Actinomycetota bacterium]
MVDQNPQDPESPDNGAGEPIPPPLPPEPTPPPAGPPTPPPTPPGGPAAQPPSSGGFDDPRLDEPPPTIPPGPPLPPPVPDYAMGPGAYDPGVNAPMLPPQPATGGTDGMSVGALVLGILSIVASCCYVGVIFGVIAIVLGIMAKNRLAQAGNPKTGMAQAGLILGIIGIALMLVFIVLAVVSGGWNYQFNNY